MIFLYGQEVKDRCTVCLEPVYEWRWFGRWIEQVFPPFPTDPYDPKCNAEEATKGQSRHIVHLICVRTWFSNGTENHDRCPTCHKKLPKMMTLEEAYEEWKLSAVKTMRKVVAICIFLFGVIGGGLTAKVLLSPHPLVSTIGMVAGWMAVSKLGMHQHVVDRIENALVPMDKLYYWYYTIYQK